MMVGLILFAETSFSEMKQSIIFDMFGSQDIGAALFFQAVIESIELDMFWGLLT